MTGDIDVRVRGQHAHGTNLATIHTCTDTVGAGSIVSTKQQGEVVSEKIALVTCITGQDGSYLAEQLLDKGPDGERP